MLLRRRLLSTAAAAARGPPPIRVDLAESAGRGVFATRPVPAGELLHSAQPLVCHPSPSLLHEVCYSCLRRKPGEGRVSSGGYYFCSDACREQAKGFHDVDKNADWSSFDDHCSSRGLKYPYMAKRLACMVISGAANADCLNILQPARLHQGTLIEMEEEFELLESTFRKAGFQEEVTSCILESYFTSFCSVMNVYNQVFIIFGFLHMVSLNPFQIWFSCNQQQQQQQHSLLSQASWGRLEMKPKRHKGHGSGTLIASLQALLSKANSSEISQSLRSLLTDSSQISLGLPLPLFTLSTRFSTPLWQGYA
ncbi:hypothetical protein PVAP13_9NG840000 [Panicum virgatum]|uniref:Uncharacterized protein n=1 Tax=Panicum virgatum TaxID=38727 RepID=A0A8T0ML61_PANVG|nr:hypothetical protein PVAP13_9NG840000 [Panicum virgatum]KAG2538171.1 hypothetical protein PVAP13_9NG840000 [Panicum virgatum]KAG2538174.1 hypothetical protein PVAP13_9NG840000 [Panicum virgatum]